MSAASSHRLEGLEPDNLLAFLALLGLLRALEEADSAVDDDLKVRARVGWDIENPPLRPRLFLTRELEQEEITQHAERGIGALASFYDFDGRRDLNYSRRESRALLESMAKGASRDRRVRADLFAALTTDAAIKDDKPESIDPTPLCLLFGQGHQHFLDRLSSVPREASPPPRGRGKGAITLTGPQCLAEALFYLWHRTDSTFSFRWDPKEDVRYALMAGDPTDGAYQGGTQHGANRLATIGLSVLTLVPRMRAGRVRPSVIGGTAGADGVAFAWPIWREPASLEAIRALLAHPRLTTPGALSSLGVDHVLISRRISVGKFMNFSRARSVVATSQRTSTDR